MVDRVSVDRIARTSALVALGTIAALGCNRTSKATAAGPPPASLRLLCAPGHQYLACRAFARSPDASENESTADDVTNSVTWSASDDTVTVIQGQIVGRRSGIATVSATQAWPGRSVSASVEVNVHGADTTPEVVYTIQGVVRDLANAGVAGVDVAIEDTHGHAGDAVTREPEGSFIVGALPAGEYRLRASKAAYRPVETTITVPNERPITVALMREPREP